MRANSCQAYGLWFRVCTLIIDRVRVCRLCPLNVDQVRVCITSPKYRSDWSCDCVAISYSISICLVAVVCLVATICPVGISYVGKHFVLVLLLVNA